MRHVRIFGRRKRPSDPVPDVQLTPRFPLAERFLCDDWAADSIDYIARLVRTEPGPQRDRALRRELRALGIQVTPAPFPKVAPTCSQPETTP